MTKDNPVPSMEVIIKKIESNFPGRLIDKPSLIKFLNGVETNKVQPIKCRQVYDNNFKELCSCTAPNCRLMR